MTGIAPCSPQTFTVTVRTHTLRTTYPAIASCSSEAWAAAAAAQGDSPCGITVIPSGAQ